MYYEQYGKMYRLCSATDREKSKNHWIKCHKENLQSKREDLIIFSAQILAQITIIENEEKEN